MDAIERIRQALADLGSPEAAARLNAQVRLREEHQEMLRFLLSKLDLQGPRPECPNEFCSGWKDSGVCPDEPLYRHHGS